MNNERFVVFELLFYLFDIGKVIYKCLLFSWLDKFKLLYLIGVSFEFLSLKEFRYWWLGILCVFGLVFSLSYKCNF